jgi:hypothetical protein
MTSGWRVARADGAHDVAMNVPGDVHCFCARVSSPILLARHRSVARLIHEADWVATGEGSRSPATSQSHTLTFDCGLPRRCPLNGAQHRHLGDNHHPLGFYTVMLAAGA